MPALLHVVALLAGLAGMTLGVAGVLGRVWTMSLPALVPLGGGAKPAAAAKFQRQAHCSTGAAHAFGGFAGKCLPSSGGVL